MIYQGVLYNQNEVHYTTNKSIIIYYYVPEGKYSDDIVVISPFPAPL